MYKGGQQCHQNDFVFQKDDVILPVNQEQLDDIEIDLIMNVKCPTHPNNECQQKKCKSKNEYQSPLTHNVESLETMESSPRPMSCENSPTESPVKEKESHTDIMMKRWQKHIEKVVNKTDLGDIKKQNRDSGQPEYAQSNYLMLRQQEEAHRIYNYFDLMTNQSYADYLNQNPATRILTRSQRSMAVYLMIELNLKRSYEIDTLFMAINIMDRYLSQLSHWNFPQE